MRLAYLYLLSFNLRVRGIKTLCHSFTRLRSTLVNMQIIKPHLHSLIGTQVSRIFYRLQRMCHLMNVPCIYREFVKMDWALTMICEDLFVTLPALNSAPMFSHVMRVAFVRLNFFQTSEVFTRQLTKVTK